MDIEISKHYPFIDGIVRSEGEETMLDIVKNKPFKKIAGSVANMIVAWAGRFVSIEKILDFEKRMVKSLE